MQRIQIGAHPAAWPRGRISPEVVHPGAGNHGRVVPAPQRPRVVHPAHQEGGSRPAGDGRRSRVGGHPRATRERVCVCEQILAVIQVEDLRTRQGRSQRGHPSSTLPQNRRTPLLSPRTGQPPGGAVSAVHPGGVHTRRTRRSVRVDSTNGGVLSTCSVPPASGVAVSASACSFSGAATALTAGVCLQTCLVRCVRAPCCLSLGPPTASVLRVAACIAHHRRLLTATAQPHSCRKIPPPCDGKKTPACVFSVWRWHIFRLVQRSASSISSSRVLAGWIPLPPRSGAWRT